MSINEARRLDKHQLMRTSKTYLKIMEMLSQSECSANIRSFEPILTLCRYAMLLADADAKNPGAGKQHIENIVKGIIEGETRVLVSSMTMEEIFTERDEFKKRIFKSKWQETSSNVLC
jgi:hypothetical protein